MLVKFFRCNPETGKAFKGPTGALDYFMSERGRSVAPEVLAGNVDLSRELVKQSEFKRPYTAGCLSFEENNIDHKQKLDIMRSFEGTLLAGLKAEQYDICWIEHRDKGRLELNFHILNTELSTGKRLQPFWKGRDLPRVDSWKQLVNDHYGFASPDDPNHKRTIQFGNNNPTRKEVIEKVDEYIFPMVANGEIKSADDLKNELNKIPSIEVISQSKSATSIKVDGFEKNIRLKGEHYGKCFTGFGNIEEIQRERARAYSEQRDKRVRENTEKLRKLNAKISKERSEQYSPRIESQQKENHILPGNTDYIGNVSNDIDRNGRQLSDDEILRDQLSNLHRIQREGQESVLQNRADNQVVNNEHSNPRAIKEPQNSNDKQGGKLINGLQGAFRVLVEKIKSFGERVSERARSAERTREQYQLATEQCQQACEHLGAAINRELLSPKQQDKSHEPRRKQRNRTQELDGPSF